MDGDDKLHPEFLSWTVPVLKEDKNIDKPLIVKISPDIHEKEISNIVEIIKKYKINGVIISNTTDKNREQLLNGKKNESGGLSGKPIKNISTNLIKKFYKELNIGVAKLPQKKLNEVTHHLINNKSIKENYSVGDYQRDFTKISNKIYKQILQLG